MTATPERIAPLTRADIAPEVLTSLRAALPRAAVYLTDAPDAPPVPPMLGLMARHPSIASGWLAHNGALLDHGVLDGRTRELLILAVVARTRSAYLWGEHVRIARRAGVTDAEIDALAARTTGETHETGEWPTVDAALLHAVDELLDDCAIDDATWATLAAHFDDAAQLEVLFVIGTYTALAMVLNGVRLAPPVGERR